MMRSRQAFAYGTALTSRAMAIAGLTLVAMTVSAAAQDDVVLRSQEANELQTDWIIGSSVQTPDGDSVGSIDALLLDQKDGAVSAAIISIGGILGIGSKQVAVAWKELDIEYDGNTIVLPITLAEAEAASPFEFRDREPPPLPEPAAGGTGLGTDPGGLVPGTGETPDAGAGATPL